MWRLSLRQLLARKLRFLSTMLAVLLGVSFLTGSLVLTDTIGRTFDDLFEEIGAGIDAQVRSADTIETDFFDVRGSIDAGLVEEIASLDAVEAAQGWTEGFAQIVGPDGEPLGNPGQGPPTLGVTWPTVPELNSMRLVGDDSRAPGAGEVVIDRGSAKETGFGVGDSVTILLMGPPREFTISGIATFGTEDSALGSTIVLFDSATAQEVLGEVGRFDGIDVVARPDLSQEELVAEVDLRLASLGVSEEVEAVTGGELIDESQDAVGEALGFFNTFMLVFAGIALFVGAFIIYNTFSIIVAQRTKEMALLRALGATSRQILTSVQIEALAVGVVASAAGVVAGLAVAAGLKSLLAGFGVDIPAGGVVFLPRTVAVAMVVGIVVTSVSAIVPAMRASRTAPMAAMRAGSVDVSGQSVVRAVLGLVTTAVGAGSILLGLFGSPDNAIAYVGFGAAVVFLGVAILGPILARPVAAAIGALLQRMRGFPGLLARENAQRNPKRTSATASALMIGVGLVAFITIFAASAKSSINQLIDDSFVGDIVIDSGTYGFGGLSPTLAQEVDALPEVRAASGVRLGFGEIDGSGEIIYGVDRDQIAEIVDVGVVAGSVESLGASEIGVHDETAIDNGWSIGDQVAVRFADSGAQTLEVAVLYSESDLAGDFILGFEAFEANFTDVFDFQVYVLTASGVSTEAARVAIEGVADRYANADVQDLTEFKDAQAAQINQLLGLIYALLGLSLLIALIGIANTLALSIVERTHEIGLLRAVGLTRGQLRAAIRWESVIIALLGAVLGLVVGVFFGWAVVKALSDEGFSQLEIPAIQLAVVAVVAAVVGMLAAAGPARRAGKFDILRAIASD